MKSNTKILADQHQLLTATNDLKNMHSSSCISIIKKFETAISSKFSPNLSVKKFQYVAVLIQLQYAHKQKQRQLPT